MKTDEKLIELYKQGEKLALDELLNRYKKTVLSIAHRFFLSRGETEDLVQEGMCGLYSAISAYNANLNANFSTFAHACIRNRIVDVVKKETGNKNSVLNNAVSIYEIREDAICEQDPAEELIKKENQREFLEKIQKILSSLEFSVIKMYLSGFPVAEIAVALDISAKSVDNALNRSKNKLYKYFKEG